MKMRVVSLFWALASMALIVGCGGEPPTSDLAAAKQALDAARAAGAEKFASSDYSAAQGAYGGAEQAVNTEAEKLFKNFDQAKGMIADAKAKADRAKAAAEAEKGRLRSAAEGAISAAASSVQQARAGVDAAPAGKGTEGDIEQLRADLGGADADINAARSAVSSEDFDQAQARAKSAQDKAAQVASGVQAATQKYEELVEKMRPWYDRI